jgi:cytosol alanyl aminopeptidase
MSRGPGHREKTLDRLTAGGLVVEELAAIVFTAMTDPAIRGPSFDFLVANYEKVTASLSPLVRPYLVRTAGYFCDEARRRQLDTVLRAKVKDTPGGTKEIEQTIERLDLCIARRAKLAPEVSAFLTKVAGRS